MARALLCRILDLTMLLASPGGYYSAIGGLSCEKNQGRTIIQLPSTELKLPHATIGPGRGAANDADTADDVIFI